MAETLKDYVRNHRARGFRSRPQYFKEGDFVAYYFKDDLAYEERIDEVVTIYRSMKTNEMVGCKVKGVSRIMKALGDFGILGVMIEDRKMYLGMFFLGAAIVHPSRQEEYKKYSTRFAKVPIDPDQLPKAA